MIDRLVHHAEVISIKGDSYRLKDRDLGRFPRPRPTTDDQQQPGVGPVSTAAAGLGFDRR